MNWALVLALVLCCGSTRGYTENESGDSLDNSLARHLLVRSRYGNGEDPTIDPDPAIEDPDDKCKDIKCKNGIVCAEGQCPCTVGLTGDLCEVVEGCTTLKPACEAINKECIYDLKKKDKATCDCGDDKKFDGKICKETCDEEAKKCAFGITCKPEDGYSFCDCPSSLTGDKCEIITDCQLPGKYARCTEAGGNCTHTGTDSVCICKNSKEYDTKTETCRETCDDADANKKCQNEAKCEDQDSLKFCNCDDGLTGDHCNMITACETGGTLALCVSSGGTCKFSNKQAFCDCGADKKFNVRTGKCSETCDDADASKKCLNEAKCEDQDSIKFCNCDDGLTGDRCNMITACETGGTLALCASGGGTCKFSNKQAFCDCGADKKFNVRTGKCSETCDDADASKKCLNEAKCEDQDSLKFCNCDDGLTGDRCNMITACETGGTLESCAIGGGICKFSNKQAFCDCGADMKFNVRTGKCSETCDDADAVKKCVNEAKCETQDGLSFCNCSNGLSGDHCKIITDCETGGTLASCGNGGGTCKFSNERAFCDCGKDKKFNIKTGKCRTPCDPKKNECANSAKCDDQGGSSFCTCVDGLTGDFCESITECQPNGKYEKCKTGGGICTFSEGKALCNCGTGKIFDFTEGQCKGACGRVICRNGAQCKSDKCECPTGLSGDDCGKVDGCSEDFQKTCKQISSTCIYDPRKESKASCECKEVNQKFDGVVCKDCTCEPHAECFFDEAKEMQCPCIENFSKNNGTCEKCDCGEFGTCSFNEEGSKVCECEGKYKDKKGTCEICDCGEFGKCEFKDDVKKCTCDDKYAEEEGTCKECDCGETDNVESCKLNKGVKICKCKGKNADRNGTCSECDCGDKAKSCTFNKEGEKVCNCVSTYADKSGTCTACECGESTSNGCEFKNGDKKCNCKAKNSQKGDECEACDCGPNGECFFNDDEEKVCKCNEKFEVKNEKCALCYCGVKGTCSFDGESKVCSCEDGYAEDSGECKACDCGSNGYCSFKDKRKTCACNDGHKERNGKCIEICDPNNSHCEHETKCSGTKEIGFFCDCQGIFIGDRCEGVKDCEIGELKGCKASGGECSYSKEKKSAVCKCSEEKLLDKILKICRKKCESDENCKHGAKCIENLCKCPTGTSGDDCSIVDGCNEALKEKCAKIPESASCVYDVTAKKATCKCDNDDLSYKDDKCIAKWCESNPCNAANSVCIYGFGSAFCKCTTVGKYYNYASGECIDISKCPLVPCKANEYCKDDGTCACNENFVKDKDGCKDERKKLCANNPCYSKATCSEGEVIGTVKCECPPNTYFNPTSLTSKTCDDGKCFLPGKRENCATPCPDTQLKREKGECVVKTEKDKCKEEKQCGPFGYCVQKGDKSTCVCIRDLAVLDKEKGVCILNKDKACASKKTLSDNPNKCDCSGMYKDSTNGITCDVMTCGDDAAQKGCQSKGAFCVDITSNKQKIGYNCNCPAGTKLNKDKGCVDICSDEELLEVCSKNQQTCYLNEKGEGTCKCPPGFAEIKTGEGDNQKITCQPTAKYAYLLKQLPVMSSEFLHEDNTVNKAKLNEYVFKSMKAVFSQYFNFGSVKNYSISDDVLLCDVWLNFDKDAAQDVKRWRSQVVTENGSIVLPPSLKLSSVTLDNVKVEKLTFCSPIVYQTACGQGSKCDKEKNACTCMDGYRVIGPTVEVVEGNTVRRCEDIDECIENTHTCKSNSKCTNTIGGYLCNCNPGFHKKDQNESDECVELCSPNPCNNGDCKVKENKVECSCKVGFKGSYCTESDDKLKQAQHSTKVVGAVLGTILAVTFVAIIAYIVKLKKNSYSEDFSSSPRDNSEMADRSRPLRGVSNRGYQ